MRMAGEIFGKSGIKCGKVLRLGSENDRRKLLNCITRSESGRSISIVVRQLEWWTKAFKR